MEREGSALRLGAQDWPHWLMSKAGRIEAEKSGAGLAALVSSRPAQAHSVGFDDHERACKVLSAEPKERRNDPAVSRGNGELPRKPGDDNTLMRSRWICEDARKIEISGNDCLIPPRGMREHS